MNILQSLLYGLVSGITEFLPVSSQGHQRLFYSLLGSTQTEPIRDLFVHIALLLALWLCSGGYIQKLRTAQHSHTPLRKRTSVQLRIYYDARLIRSACVPAVLGTVLYALLFRPLNSILLIALFMSINGTVLYLTEYIAFGNKSAGKMSAMDAYLIGFGAMAAACPGISRIAGSMCIAVYRGADRARAYEWALVISVPVLICLAVIDVVTSFTVGAGRVVFLTLLGYLVSAVGAFASAVAGIYLMRNLILSRTVGSGFSLYCWGISLLTFILYLIV